MDTGKKRKVEAATSKKRKSYSILDDKSKFAKRPMTAFFLFSQTLREDIKKNGGSVSGVENVAKMAGKKWGELTEEQRKPYVEKAAADRKRYEKELASGLVPPPRKTKNVKKAKKAEKDPNRPKRASSAYLYYMSDFRKTPEGKALKHTEVMKAAADKWKSLAQNEKTKYLELEKKDKERFAKEMETYKESAPSKKPQKGVKKTKAPPKQPSSESESESESHDESDIDDDDQDSDEE